MFVSLEENLIEVHLRISFEVAISKIKSSIISSVYKFASYIRGGGGQFYVLSLWCHSKVLLYFMRPIYNIYICIYI